MPVPNQLLEETCQAAIAILPCTLAWMFVVEGTTLRSRAIASELGPNAAEVFLRLVNNNVPGHPTFPLESGLNPISEAALNGIPMVNVEMSAIQRAAGGASLYRAMAQLRLTHIHFLPLSRDDQLAGVLVLAGREAHPEETPRGKQILSVLTSQAATVVGNVRLLADLALREEQMKVEQSFRKMVLDTMGDGLVVIDEMAIIRFVNNRLLRMSGYSRQEVNGQSVGVIFHPEGREQLVNGLRRQSGATVNFSQQIVTKDGRIVPVLMSRSMAANSPTSNNSTVLVLSDMTEQKKREEALERQGERLRALNRAARAITSALTLDDVVQVIVLSAMQLVNASSACVLLIDESDPDMLRVADAEGPQAHMLKNATVPLGTGIAGEIATSHQPQLILDVELDSPDQIEREGSAVIGVPLMILEEVIGVLETINKIDGRFSREDVEILENLASAAAVALENARLFEQTQRRINELSILLEASAAVSSTLEIGSVLEFVARRLTSTMDVARCSIAMLDSLANQLIVLAEACDTSWAFGAGPSRPVVLTPIGMAVIQRMQPTIVAADTPSLDPRLSEYFAQSGMRCAAFLPLHIGGIVVGLIELYSTQSTTAFTPYHLRAVEEAITRWNEQIRRGQTAYWFTLDRENDLAKVVMQSAEANWCVIAAIDSRERSVRAIRELGFALWDDQSGVTHQLDQYPAMGFSIEQGAPMTLQPVTLVNDPNENRAMTRLGVHTGLITPLISRGVSNGLIKLLDNKVDRRFDLDEISLCQGIANVVSNAMENAQLYQSLERRANALQAAYNELHEADKVKDDLIQNLSHELQTPLHQVIMELDLLIGGAFGPLVDDQRDIANSIMNRVTRLGDLVRSIVSLRSAEMEQLHFRPVTVESVITDAIHSLLPKAARASIRMIPAIQPDLPAVNADPTRLSELVIQLIDNAIKFSPKSDRIDIRADDPGGRLLHICVQDYGIGIPETEYDKIFQRGYQVDGSMTRRYGGMGLGLAVARQIVEAHGGKLWVESKVGTGSQFHVSIPKAE